MEAMDPWKKIREAKEAYEAEVKAIGQDQIAKVMVDAFAEVDKIPGGDHVLAVRWSQYTPYFNDGDSCEFSVNDPHVRLSKVAIAALRKVEEDEDEDWEDGYSDTIRRKFVDGEYDHDGYSNGVRGPDGSFPRKAAEPWVAPMSPELLAAIEILEGLVGGIPEDVMRSAFGDHVRVEIDRNGITVEEFNHD